MEPKSLEEWRKYFESGNCSIYQIIFNAIRVAALDDPEEFNLRRNKIVERLYSYQFTGLCGCCVDQPEQDIHGTVKQVLQNCKNEGTNKSTTVDDSAVGGERATDSQANELRNKEEDEDETVRCVLQIRDELERNKLLTESEIYESLKKLQSVVQSVATMEATTIGRTVSNLRRHRSKDISLLARTMARQWKSMIVELVDKKTETAEKSKNPAPGFVLEEWREFPSVEYVPQPPVAFSEKFLDDMDDYYEITGKTDATGKDNNETDHQERHKNAAKEKETEPKLRESMQPEKTKKESVEKVINHRKSNGSSDKSHVKVEKTGAATDKNPSMGTKRKLEDAEFNTPIRRQKVVPPKKESNRHKPSKSAPCPNLPKTEHSSDRDRKPRVKKEVQNHNSEPRNRYRALLINTESRDASLRAREPRRSSDNTAMEERLENSKKKLQVGYEAHERAKKEHPVNSRR